MQIRIFAVTAIALALPSVAQVPDDRDPRNYGHTTPSFPCEWRPLHGNCHVDSIEWQNLNHTTVRIFVNMHKDNSCRRLSYRLAFADGTTSEQTTHVYGNDRWVVDSFLDVNFPKGQPKFLPLTCEVGYPGRPSGGYAELGPDGRPLPGPAPVVHPNPPIELVHMSAPLLVVTYAPWAKDDRADLSPEPQSAARKPPPSSAEGLFGAAIGKSPEQLEREKKAYDDAVAAGGRKAAETLAMFNAAAAILGTAGAAMAARSGGGKVDGSSGSNADGGVDSGPVSGDCDAAQQEVVSRIERYLPTQRISGDVNITCRSYRNLAPFYESQASALGSACGSDHRFVSSLRKQASSYRDMINSTCR